MEQGRSLHPARAAELGSELAWGHGATLEAGSFSPSVSSPRPPRSLVLTPRPCGHICAGQRGQEQKAVLTPSVLFSKSTVGSPELTRQGSSSLSLAKTVPHGHLLGNQALWEGT